MEREFEIAKIESADISYSEGEREASYYMDGRKVLKYLSQRPDLASKFEEFIPPQEFTKLSDPEFQDSDRYKELATRIDEVAANNKEANKIWERFLPIMLDALNGYIARLGIDLDPDEIRKRSEGLSIICLDIYRFWANIIKRGIREDASGIYQPKEKLIAYTMTHFSKRDFERLSTRAQFENIKSLVLHELIHALSYQNFWISYKEKEGGGKVPEGIITRRIGIGGTTFGKTLKLEPLNEAITQRLVKELLPSILEVKDEVKAKFVDREDLIYKEEQEVLSILTRKIDWKIFVAALFSKDGLPQLARSIREQYGLSLKELSDLMRLDSRKSQNQGKGCKYELTKQRLGSI